MRNRATHKEKFKNDDKEIKNRKLFAVFTSDVFYKYGILKTL